jgi:NADH-quinone oxidoreductase subunit I
MEVVSVFGFGLIKGLFTTAKRFMMPKITQKYPEIQPNLPERSKGSFTFNKETCISCELCSGACPNGVIVVEWHAGDDKKRKLDRYRMNLGHCLFCGLCVEACPNGSIAFKREFALACYRKEDIYRLWVRENPAVADAAVSAPVEGA